MNPDPEEDALSWDGDEALQARSPAPRAEGQLASARQAQAASAPQAKAVQADATQPEGIGTVTLVLLGILGGIYLLYTIGWVVGGMGMQSQALFLLPAPLYQAGLWIAVLAPALWFTATLVMTSRSKDWVRIVALIVGALLLVPWPFVVAGGGGVL